MANRSNDTGPATPEAVNVPPTLAALHDQMVRLTDSSTGYTLRRDELAEAPFDDIPRSNRKVVGQAFKWKSESPSDMVLPAYLLVSWYNDLGQREVANSSIASSSDIGTPKGHIKFAKRSNKAKFGGFVLVGDKDTRLQIECFAEEEETSDFQKFAKRIGLGGFWREYSRTGRGERRSFQGRLASKDRTIVANALSRIALPPAS